MSLELNVINQNEDFQGCGPDCDHFDHCGRTIEDHLKNLGIEIPQFQETEPDQRDTEEPAQPETTTPEQDAETAQNISSQKAALLETHSFSREHATLKFFKNPNGEIDLRDGEGQGLLETFKDTEATTPGSISRDEYKGYIEQLYTQKYVQIPCPNEKGDLIFVTELSLDAEGNVTQTEYKLKEQEDPTETTDPENQIIDDEYEIATVDKSPALADIESKPTMEVLDTPAAQKISTETGITLAIQTAKTTTKPETPSLFQQGIKIFKTEVKHLALKTLAKKEPAKTQDIIADKDAFAKPTEIEQDIAQPKMQQTEKIILPDKSSIDELKAQSENKGAITISQKDFEKQTQPGSEAVDESTETQQSIDRSPPITTEEAPKMETKDQSQQVQEPVVKKTGEIVLTGISIAAPETSAPKEKTTEQEAGQTANPSSTLTILQKVEKLKASVKPEDSKTTKITPDQPTPETPNMEISKTGETTIQHQIRRIVQKTIKPEAVAAKPQTRQSEITAGNGLETLLQRAAAILEQTEKTQKANLQENSTPEKPALKTRTKIAEKKQQEIISSKGKREQREKVLSATSMEKLRTKPGLAKEKERLSQEVQTALDEIKRVWELRRAYEQLSGNKTSRYSPPQNDVSNLLVTLTQELEQIAA